MKTWKVLVIAALVGLTTIVQADIVMFDLNGNAGEVEVAKKAAAGRGEKLIVLGQLTKEDQTEIDKIEMQIADLRKGYRGPKVGRRKNLKMQVNELREKQRKFKYSMPKLEADLERLERSNLKLTSVVMSGHDGNGHFWGKYGTIESENLRKAVERTPALAEGVRSVFLAGCYTVTPGALDQYWKGIWPNAELIGGYEHSAPAGNSKPGWLFLGDFLKKDKALIAEADAKKLRVAFKKLSSINNINGSICSKDMFVSNDKQIDMKKRAEECRAMVHQSNDWTGRINCYLEGLPGCENPPDDTAHGELRVIYMGAQDVLGCAKEDFPTTSIDRDQLIRLILYKNVAKNASINDAEFFEQYDLLLDKVGMGTEALGDISRLSRKDLNSKIETIAVELEKRQHENSNAYDSDLTQLQMETRKIADTLRYLEPNCIPDDWLEGGAHSSSSCLTRDSSGN